MEEGPFVISEDEWAGEEHRLGRRVHEHEGLWWATVQPFYCKPLFEFRPFAKGAARPSRGKSLFGYSHQVPTREEANRIVTYMVLEGDDLRSFRSERLKASKRNQVKKGLTHCAVRTILDVEPLLERMRAINVVQARRFENLGERGGFRPSIDYESHAEEWRSETRREFSHRGKRWWGAFKDEVLVAYLVAVTAGQTRIIGAVKSDPAFLQYCPVDALYFRVLEEASQNKTCLQVVNGGTHGERPGLTHFKEQFLFSQKEVPYFTSNETLLRLGRKAATSLSGMRARLVRPLVRRTKVG